MADYLNPYSSQFQTFQNIANTYKPAVMIAGAQCDSIMSASAQVGALNALLNQYSVFSGGGLSSAASNGATSPITNTNPLNSAQSSNSTSNADTNSTNSKKSGKAQDNPEELSYRRTMAAYLRANQLHSIKEAYWYNPFTFFKMVGNNEDLNKMLENMSNQEIREMLDAYENTYGESPRADWFCNDKRIKKAYSNYEDDDKSMKDFSNAKLSELCADAVYQATAAHAGSDEEALDNIFNGSGITDIVLAMAFDKSKEKYNENINEQIDGDFFGSASDVYSKRIAQARTNSKGLIEFYELDNLYQELMEVDSKDTEKQAYYLKRIGKLTSSLSPEAKERFEANSENYNLYIESKKTRK